MMISVVIPTLNRSALLARTLPTVLAQTVSLDAGTMEIIVVQDGPDEETASYLRSIHSSVPFTVVEHSTNRGLSAARNEGIRRASGDVVLFLDDDLRCHTGLVAAHLEAHARRQPLATFGVVQTAAEYPRSGVIAWAREADRWTDALAVDATPRWPEHASIDANCAVTRAELLVGGGYLETLGARENAEMGLRLWERGIPFEFLSAARADHCYEKTAQTLVERDAVRYGREEVELGQLHPRYRSKSVAASMAAGPGWRRLVRTTLARAPHAAERLLGTVYNVLDRVPDGAAAGLSSRVLKLRQSAQINASAIRAVGSWDAWQSGFGVRLPILLYHNVGRRDLGEHRNLSVSPERFASHIEWLSSRGYSGIRPADWIAWRMHGTPLPRKPIMITFDDGYAELAEHALPVLENHGFGAAVFVPTACIGRTLPWDDSPVMTAATIREWAGRGIEFGAHTRTHPDLRGLSDDELRREIDGSRQDLEDLLGASPVSFAYPFGFHDARALERASAQFELAFSTLEGINDITTDPLLLRRTNVQSGDGAVNLAARVRLGFDPIEKARIKVGLRTRLRLLRAGKLPVLGR